MSGRPSRSLPPLHRAYEGSRLESQQLIAAYEQILFEFRPLESTPPGVTAVPDRTGDPTLTSQGNPGVR